jgi:L-arabinokinase
MDQVTSALGRDRALTVLKCQPHELLGVQRVPPGWRFFGLDSRVKHSVGGARYTKARVGAFMGLKIIQLESGGKLLDNYLCNMTPAEFAAYRDMIPETLTGAQFSEAYGQLPDRVTTVDPAETYHPRACAEHPILENDRVRVFVALMHIASLRREERSEQEEDGLPESPPPEADGQLMQEAGLLMYEAHASYSDRLDLGAPETDLLVDLIRERGVKRRLYGAKITGGGGGGTVAVLCDDSHEAEEALASVCREYESRIGMAPRPLVGSSPGAVMFGARYITRG